MQMIVKQIVSKCFISVSCSDVKTAELKLKFNFIPVLFKIDVIKSPLKTIVGLHWDSQPVGMAVREYSTQAYLQK
jgi:hypothetical protein